MADPVHSEIKAGHLERIIGGHAGDHDTVGGGCRGETKLLRRLFCLCSMRAISQLDADMILQSQGGRKQVEDKTPSHTLLNYSNTATFLKNYMILLPSPYSLVLFLTTYP